LLNALGISQKWFKWLKAENPSKGDDILNVSCKDIKPHPLTTHVKEFKTACAGEIICTAENVRALIKTPADCNQPGVPVMAALEYGKGRVVYISDYWWLRPFNLEKADNAQLFFNIINWLAGKPIKSLDKEKQENALYITAGKLEKAEEAEAEGKFEFKPFSRSKTYLGKGGEIKGISGNDPIVDILKN
jgi:hypothetical protein